MFQPPAPRPDDAAPVEPAPRTPPTLFRVWLGFFLISTVLGFTAIFFVGEAVIGPIEPAVLPPLEWWLIQFLVPAPVSFWAFRRAVAKFRGAAAPLALPVFGPWLRYYIPATILGYLLSVGVGAVVGVVIREQRGQFDGSSPLLLLVIGGFSLAPASWGPFRTVVPRYFPRVHDTPTGQSAQSTDAGG